MPESAQMVKGRHALVALGLVASASVARAGDGAMFARTDACDELSLARAADVAGDRALLEAMEGERYSAVIAIRASAYASAPELLIPVLARHACGRDPTLAAEAAIALRALAPRLVASELAAREVLQGDLERARNALHCELAPRADIAASLEQLAPLLR